MATLSERLSAFTKIEPEIAILRKFNAAPESTAFAEQVPPQRNFVIAKKQVAQPEPVASTTFTPEPSPHSSSKSRSTGYDSTSTFSGVQRHASAVVTGAYSAVGAALTPQKLDAYTSEPKKKPANVYSFQKNEATNPVPVDVRTTASTPAASIPKGFSNLGSSAKAQPTVFTPEPAPRGAVQGPRKNLATFKLDYTGAGPSSSTDAPGPKSSAPPPIQVSYSAPPSTPVIVTAPRFVPPPQSPAVVVVERPRVVQSTPTPVPVPFKANSDSVCVKCGTPVFAMEKVQVDGALYHKCCMRCHECDCTLSAGKYAGVHGLLFCKPHFTQMFKLKGNYDEGFGAVQRKNQTK